MQSLKHSEKAKAVKQRCLVNLAQNYLRQSQKAEEKLVSAHWKEAFGRTP